MKKDEICSKLRTYVREELSPTASERKLVSSLYKSVCDVLGSPAWLQIGSYPRYTAIRPLHDLDVLYIIGEWSADADPSETLTELKAALDEEFENPTDYTAKITLQSHSVTIAFETEGEEVFAVDVVPAYKDGKNGDGEDKYQVPEVIRKNRAERRVFVEQLEKAGQSMTWIPSDPRGYINQARDVNGVNGDFSKAVKLVKAWRYSCKEHNEDFPLKSFHLELLVTEFFRRSPAASIFDAVFDFFVRLPEYIAEPRLRDKADTTRFVDAYVAELTDKERDLVARLRDHFLIALENIEEDSSVADLVAAGERHRASNSEQYLFDQGIPVLTEATLTIIGNVQQREGGFRARILDALGVIEVDRKIDFQLGPRTPAADVFKWKVKNDDNSPQPRGEITDHRTLRSPEHTKYNGRHFVECFAIRNGVCIARSRQNVVLRAE
ncbi:nucleotidyltransferase [Maritimibacter sp. 55A14]|uniref:nucleotidyltransferase n=1 Tax=Maritimibacter sp. 55A14 TaxID=2174844 RepID=UPI0011B1E8E6|nr:nucleotidyltransferase [Maritimibacter sp. 55A14]